MGVPTDEIPRATSPAGQLSGAPRTGEPQTTLPFASKPIATWPLIQAGPPVIAMGAQLPVPPEIEVRNDPSGQSLTVT